MNVLNVEQALHNAQSMRFSCSQQSILSNGLWEFGTARGHLCADVLQTAYVGFSTLTSRQKTKQTEETNRNHAGKGL